MKPIQKTFLLISLCSLLSCDTEESRTPLGITISAPDFETTIEENPGSDIILGTLSAIASDSSTIQYGNIIDEDTNNSKFESETPTGALDINNVTGELTIKDVTQFDFDLNTEINAVVNARSGNVIEVININIFLREFLDINSDRQVLIDIFESNVDTTDTSIEPILDWPITEDGINDWTGVTIANERVTSLNLSGSNLTIIPESISKLSELTTLNLSNNLLNTIPESIIELENLTTLDITSNEILDLPSGICDTFNNDTLIKDDTLSCSDEIDEETDN